MTKAKTVSQLKKWIPIAGIVLITIALMIFFKLNRQGYQSVKDVGRNLLAQFTENLKSVYSKTNLTKEDVFNFALYQNLPIDKENNKILQIETDDEGKDSYIIKKAQIKEETKNYSNFIKKLALSEQEKMAFDSLLDSYNEDLYSYILYNDSNSLAIDPKLSILQKAISTDIYDYSRKRLYKKTQKELPTNYALLNKEKIHRVLDEAKLKPEKDFIFFTPDTVFKHIVKVIIEKPDDRLTELTKEISDVNAIAGQSEINVLEQPDVPSIVRIDLSSDNRDYMNYQIDSNYYAVVIPESYHNIEGLPNYDSLRKSLEDMEIKLNSISFSYHFDDDYNFNFEVSDFTNEDTLKSFNFEFNLKELGSFISQTVEAATEFEDNDWEKFGLKMDSLARSMKAYSLDTIEMIKLKELSRELKKFKEEQKEKKENSEQ